MAWQLQLPGHFLKEPMILGCIFLKVPYDFRQISQTGGHS